MKTLLASFMVLLLTCSALSAQKADKKVTPDLKGNWKVVPADTAKMGKNKIIAFQLRANNEAVFTNAVNSKTLSAETGEWKINADSLIVTLYKGTRTAVKDPKAKTVKLNYSETSKKEVARILRFKFKLTGKKLVLLSDNKSYTFNKVAKLTELDGDNFFKN